MAGELRCSYTTGATLYARVSIGAQWLNGTTPEAYNAAHWANYAVAMTEEGTSGDYVGNMPAAAAGLYGYECRKQVGVSPAVTDPKVAGPGDVNWSGAAEILPLTAQGVADAAKLTPSAGVPATGSLLALIDASINEAIRNTDPGEANVRSGVHYKVQNETKTGTLTGIIEVNGSIHTFGCYVSSTYYTTGVVSGGEYRELGSTLVKIRGATP